ncbi:glycosyltransferase family 4 protein [Calidithermus timidus]|uniref:glycosyltransferase family 4 protein n=1 Tax=Calidithermus timidus TaxID=307124 RepID=UPI001B7F9607|nr:glycosyltransferase family 4 protein [Calidithermus timidus]
MEITQRAFLLPISQYLRSQGWLVDAVAAEIKTCTACQSSYDRIYEIDWTRNPLNLRNLTRASAQVRKIVERGDYDLVHVHTPVAAFVTRYALRNLRRIGKPKIIYTAHGFHFHRNGRPLSNAIFLGLEKLAGRWTDYLVVINREDEAAARRYRIVPPERVRYMPGIGIDLDQYTAERVSQEDIKRVREELKLEERHKLLLMVAAFDPGKRHKDAIEALALLRRKEVVLAFAGEGPLRPRIEELAQRVGVAEQVRFLGFRKDIPALMRASVATVLTSEREGLPRAVMESMALGVPVIGADARGTRDLLESGAGIVVPVGNVVALAEAMQYLINHPEEADRMGKHGLGVIRAYDLANILRLHVELYDEALREKRSAVFNA